MTDRYFTRDGARIAYQFTGSGRPLGYAHGVPLSRAAVRRLDLLDLDALAEGRRMLTYDQRGHGESTGRPIVDDYRFENFTQDLLGLMDELGVDQPMDFAGSSPWKRQRAASRSHRAAPLPPPGADDSASRLG